MAERARDQLGGSGIADVVVAAVYRRRPRRRRTRGGRPRMPATPRCRGEAGARQATIWLGHTLDDQAENVLLGLARGSGLRSLAGMAARTGRLVRPLARAAPVGDRAGLRRARARPVARPAQRPTRGSPAYASAGPCCPPWRPSSVPGWPRPWPGRLRWPARMPTCSTCWPPMPIRAPTPSTPRPLLDRPAALRTRVIRRWLLRHGADEVTARHVAAVDALVTRWHGQGEIHLPGVRVTRQDGSLHCQPDE